MKQFLDNWVAVVGFFSSVIMLYRMFLGIEQEFSETEEIIRDPLGFAVKETATLCQFQANSWKAFDALLTAIRFRNFHRRYRLLIDPRDSKICVLLLLAMFIFSIVYATLIVQSDPKVNNVIGGVFALVILLWWALVDRGKALKKSVEKLRIT